MTSALAPTLSPKRGRIVRRFFENFYDWIGRTLIRITGNERKPFPLLSAFASGFGAISSKRSEDGGERMKGEGGRKTQIYSRKLSYYLSVFSVSSC